MAEVAREELNQSTTIQLDSVPVSLCAAPVGGGMDLSVWGKTCRALRPSCCSEPVLGQTQVGMLDPLVQKQSWNWLHSLP